MPEESHLPRTTKFWCTKHHDHHPTSSPANTSCQSTPPPHNSGPPFPSGAVSPPSKTVHIHPIPTIHNPDASTAPFPSPQSAPHHPLVGKFQWSSTRARFPAAATRYSSPSPHQNETAPSSALPPRSPPLLRRPSPRVHRQNKTKRPSHSPASTTYSPATLPVHPCSHQTLPAQSNCALVRSRARRLCTPKTDAWEIAP